MIDLLPSDEQQQMIDTARALLAARLPVDRLRTRRQGDPALSSWNEFIKFGWFLFGLPEAAGGLGVGLPEETLLAREAGRFLLPPAVLATTLAAKLAAQAGNPALCAAIGEGSARAGFAVKLVGGESGWLLTDAAEASHLVEVTVDTVTLFPVSAFRSRRPLDGIDEAVSLEQARKDDDCRGDGAPGLARLAGVLVAASLCGVAEACLELTVAYAKIREQFGRPIGSFQAVKHRCADMAVRAETAAAQVAMAALSEAGGEEDAGVQVFSALITAISAARENAAAAIQLHGGMGFTWECHAHRYIKRAQLFTQLLGGSRPLEDRLLSALGMG